MSNRAERRARARSTGKNGDNQFTGGKTKSRRGVVDEIALQEKARRLANGETGEWKPSGHRDFATSALQSDLSLNNPKVIEKPHSVKQWFRILSWTLIILSVIAFLVAMWIPNVPMWAIITISAVFVVGVLSLFFVAGSYKENPRLDSYGAAV
ncbi:membrane protein [Bombiscardovia apis]|uniref:Membrane protein n=1 Tax=Bombiscardovia apis TaxID=2932182 RepID=A0ABM8BDC1_9BIFI|nr:tripartite tricarboxylate transporter TctB family protein [Bombiscardovia apis]BDR54725.1 membrane protein [Bombiscardovia apis]